MRNDLIAEAAEREFEAYEQQIAALRADLARALPVVEAAGALVSHAAHRGHVGWEAHLEYLLDALALAVRAAREPRTGEGAK